MTTRHAHSNGHDAPRAGEPAADRDAHAASGTPTPRPGPDPRSTGGPAREGDAGLDPRLPVFIRRLIRSRREFERTVEVIRKAARFLFQSQLPRMAAALSYRTIFGLVPTLVIAIAVLGTFANEASLQSTLRQILIYTGISEIEIDQTKAAEAERIAAYESSNPLFAHKTPVVESMTRDRTPIASSSVFGTTRQPGAAPTDAPPTDLGPVTPKLEDWISEMVSRVRGIAFGAIGAVGVLMLVYAAISMLIEVERAFNDIYHAPAGRAWGRRIPLYWTMLTLGVVLILATFFLGARATAWLAQLTPALAPGTGLGALVTFIATVLTSMVLLLGMYLWVPNTRVTLRPALAGSFVAALLWETGKLGLQRYIEFSASYAKLYGSLGLLPLLLLWIYVTWLIVLFGLQVAYALQHFQSWRAEDASRDSTPAVIEPAAILALATQIARAFDQGKTLSLPTLATGAGIDDRIAALMLDRLIQAGVAARTEHPREGVTLARPASQVAMGDLLKIGYEMVGQATGPAIELRRQSLRCLEGRTLDAAKGHAAPTADEPGTHTPGADPAADPPEHTHDPNTPGGDQRASADEATNNRDARPGVASPDAPADPSQPRGAPHARTP